MAVIVSVGVLFITFGIFTSFAWGNQQTTPLITDLLPNYVEKDGNITYFVYIVLFLFSLNLVFSFPLQIYPVEIIVENLLFDGWPKSRKRQMYKNMSRSVIVFLVVCMTIMLKDKFDKFLAILGSVTCTPMAFTFPAIFHLKAVAETPAQKGLDIFILLVSMGVFFYCTYQGLVDWGKEDDKPNIYYPAVHPELKSTPQEDLSMPDL